MDPCYAADMEIGTPFRCQAPTENIEDLNTCMCTRKTHTHTSTLAKARGTTHNIYWWNHTLGARSNNIVWPQIGGMKHAHTRYFAVACGTPDTRKHVPTGIRCFYISVGFLHHTVVSLCTGKDSDVVFLSSFRAMTIAALFNVVIMLHWCIFHCWQVREKYYRKRQVHTRNWDYLGAWQSHSLNIVWGNELHILHL